MLFRSDTELAEGESTEVELPLVDVQISEVPEQEIFHFAPPEPPSWKLWLAIFGLVSVLLLQVWMVLGSRGKRRVG